MYAVRCTDISDYCSACGKMINVAVPVGLLRATRQYDLRVRRLSLPAYDCLKPVRCDR